MISVWQRKVNTLSHFDNPQPLDAVLFRSLTPPISPWGHDGGDDPPHDGAASAL